MKVVFERNVCPSCGVDARLMAQIVGEERKLNNVGEGTLACTQAKIITNIDPRKPPIAGGRIKSARVLYDICTKCGKEYVVRIEQGFITIPLSPQQQPTFA
jgi:hypothetical protein